MVDFVSRYVSLDCNHSYRLQLYLLSKTCYFLFMYWTHKLSHAPYMHLIAPLYFYLLIKIRLNLSRPHFLVYILLMFLLVSTCTIIKSPYLTLFWGVKKLIDDGQNSFSSFQLSHVFFYNWEQLVKSILN